MLHPAVLIFFWMGLSLAIQGANTTTLAVVGVLLVALALWRHSARLFTLLRRMRWLFAGLILAYAYATPGTGVWPALAQFSPTIEGTTSGLLQAFRILSILAGLAILLDVLSLGQWVSGLYVLSRPLQFAGLPRERFAVRLVLTLRYAETALAARRAGNWRAHVDDMMRPVEDGHEIINLRMLPLSRHDRLLLVAVSAFLMLLIVHP